jgi:UDP-N-acetylmuramoylalanine--D-glutamate ligase
VSEEIRDPFPLPGRANLSNLAAAVAIARHFGAEDDRIKSCLPEFKALPHRLEFVEQIDGVSWHNDSIATTPQSTIAALEAFEEPVIIIAGGYDKKLPFDRLGQEIGANTKAAILIGQTAEKIANAIEKELATEATEPRTSVRGPKVQIVSSLAKAVKLAHDLAVAGDVVLLSPACASYDMFDNFQHRGREFVRLVREISG